MDQKMCKSQENETKEHGGSEPSFGQLEFHHSQHPPSSSLPEKAVIKSVIHDIGVTGICIYILYIIYIYIQIIFIYIHIIPQSLKLIYAKKND